MIYYIRNLYEEYKEIQTEFEKRKQAAADKYWNACKFPRKTKKRLRKEALIDYELYTLLLNDY